MFVVRRRNNFLGFRNNLKFAGHVSPSAAAAAVVVCMLVITDAIMTTTIMSRIAITIVVAPD